MDIRVVGENPTRRHVIARPRLTQLLDESPSRVILLVGPAGYGKTTLAAEWLGQAERRGAWFRANTASGDVAALALEISSAAGLIVPGAGQSLHARLRASPNPALDSTHLARALANDLLDWPDGAWLVIDDYHLLSSSVPAEQFVSDLIASSTVSVLITSRARPTWVSARALLYGEVHEIGRQALAMTDDEANDVLSRSRARAEKRSFVALADGWPALIGLAAFSATPPSVAEVFPETLHAYIAEELFQAARPRLRRNLCQLALAPTIDDRLVTALFGSHASRVVEEASRLGFLSIGPGGFDIHPLLRQFLRNKSIDDSETQQITTRIASFYLETRRWDDAFSVAEEFDLQEILIEVLSNSLDALLADGRLATLERWLSTMRSRGLNDPLLRLTEAELALRDGRCAQAEETTASLARTLRADHPLLARVLYRAGNCAQLNENTSVALEFHREAQRRAKSSVDLRHALWGRFICAMELEQLDDAAEAFREFEALPATSPEDVLRRYQAQLLSAKRSGSGIEKAVNMSRSGLAVLQQACDPLIRTGFTHTFASALVLAAQYEEGLGLLNGQIEEANRLGLAFVVTHSLGMKAAAEVGLRQFSAAEQTLDAAVREAREHRDVHAEMNATAIRMRLLLARARLDDALSLARLHWRRMAGPGMYGELLATQALAFACAGDSQASEAAAVASGVSNQLEALVLRAFARAIVAIGSLKGDAFVEDAFAVTETTENYDGFVNAYRACPQILKTLAESPNRWTILEDVVKRVDPHLQSRFGLHSAPEPSGSALSPRESEVLELLREGLSNKEIARKLWISESTTKVHVRHILRKLGVRTRTQAAIWEPTGRER